MGRGGRVWVIMIKESRLGVGNWCNIIKTINHPFLLIGVPEISDRGSGTCCGGGKKYHKKYISRMFLL